MKLSIIVPVFNVQPYLAKCLDSVLYPQLEDYEIIIVNDGSTDLSPAIASHYADRFPGLVHLISTPNGGLGHARNVGIAAAHGEYLLFLDGDDYLSPGAVPELLSAAGSDDIRIFDLRSVDENGKQLKYMPGCSRPGTFSLTEYPQLLFDLPNACGKLIRRRLFTDNGISFPDRLWFEDLATVPKLYLHAQNISHIPRPWYTYLQRPGSITNCANTARNLEIITAVDEILAYYRCHDRYEVFAQELGYMAFYNQLLTSTTRVNLIDRKSPVQGQLLDGFTQQFPDFYSNKYVSSMPIRHKLLLSLITRRKYDSLHLILRLNRLLQGR